MKCQFLIKKHLLPFYLIGLFLLLMGQVCFSQTIIIAPNTVVSHSMTYDNVTLDMTNGSFIVKDNATLTINDSIINGNLSKKNPVLITVENGNLQLTNNQANIVAVGVDPHPLTQSLYHMVKVAMGGLTMTGNSFQVDQPFTVGLLITTSSIPTSGFQILNNKFERFHGVLYLISVDNALVSNNTFVQNSYGNLVVIGSNSQITQNTIYFSGNNRLGNSIDIIDSNNITLSKNLLFTPTCHGIYIFNSTNVTVDSNRISGGITYAITVLTYPEKLIGNEKFISNDYLKDIIGQYKMKNLISANVTITNNFMSQNRYGIAASDTNGLNISNNIFIQRFSDNDARTFWTNNNILLQNVTGLTWSNNLYKEAFTQEDGDNSKSFNFVVFPQTGGVSL